MPRCAGGQREVPDSGPGHAQIRRPRAAALHIVGLIDADGGLSNRVFADGVAPEHLPRHRGAIWVGTGFLVTRVADGGQVPRRVELPENRAPFALVLGGSGRRTPFILTAEWRPADGHVANLDRLANGPAPAKS